MREILFRGKDKYGKWAFGGLVVDDWRGDFIITEEDCSGAYRDEIEVYDGDVTHIDIATAGQYTGLTDKNGQKIFEGDIIKIYLYEPKGLANYEIGCIRYDDAKARFVFCTEEGNYSIDNTNTYEVIGNIHDNPELLKGGAE